MCMYYTYIHTCNILSTYLKSIRIRITILNLCSEFFSNSYYVFLFKFEV